MVAVLLTTLFAASAITALAVMASSLRRHGRAALALRGELAACADARDARVTIVEMSMRSNATVLRPRFTPYQDRSPLSAGRRCALPAAA